MQNNQFRSHFIHKHFFHENRKLQSGNGEREKTTQIAAYTDLFYACYGPQTCSRFSKCISIRVLVTFDPLICLILTSNMTLAKHFIILYVADQASIQSKASEEE